MSKIEKQKEIARELLSRLPAQGNTILPPWESPFVRGMDEVEVLRVALSAFTEGSDEKKKGLSFPTEYKGWRVEIKMGHEFKGTRGSTRRSRGYVATNLSTGDVQEFPPSAGHSVGFLAVRQWIDLVERMTPKESGKLS